MFDTLSTLHFIILALATYRLAVLVSSDDGPFDLCWRLRDYVRLHTAEQPVTQVHDYVFRGLIDGYEQGQVPSNLSRGLECPLCMSVWFSAILLLCYWLAPGITLPVATVFALSGVTVLIERIGKS